MKKVTMFVVTACPYCTKGYQALEDLKKENPAYQDVELEIINEDENPEYVEAFDYYATPSLFIGHDKIFETKLFDSYDVIKAGIKKAFDQALQSAD